MPSSIPRAYSVERSRANTSTPVWARRHAASDSDVRSGRRLTGQWLSRSTRGIVDDPCPPRFAPPPSPIVKAEHTRRLGCWSRVTMEESEDRVCSGRHPQLSEKAGTGRSPSHESDADLSAGEPVGTPRVRGNEVWEAAGERFLGAGPVLATEAADPQSELDGAVADREVGRGATVVAVAPVQPTSTLRAVGKEGSRVSAGEQASFLKLDGGETAPQEFKRNSTCDYGGSSQVVRSHDVGGCSAPRDHTRCGRID